ncbi:MAG: hypothetical protein Q8P41_04555 [Pseudomonadota bacterium]|nr:hypothetical protein [Pseudomonadota bacterium]
MSKTIEGALRQGATFDELLTSLAGLSESGKKLSVQIEARCVPYMKHTVVGWVDGPPSSTVTFVLSGADPRGEAWRRFTLSRKDDGHYELACFPTPFHNSKDPLSPGIPPSSSRRAS